MQKQNCLVISSPYYWGGGIKTMIEEGLKILKSLGYRTALVMPSYTKERDKSRIKAKKISTIQFLNFDKYPLLHHLLFGLKLKNFRQKYNAALAIVATSHTAFPLALSGKPFCIWVATSYADELDAKINSTLRDKPAKKLRNSIQWWFLEEMEKYVLKKATNILALSDYTASKLLALEPSIKTKLGIFNVPINTNLFSPKRGIIKKKGLLISTGRINDPRKNTPLLIKALSRITKDCSQTKLLLIGEKPNTQLINLIKSLDLEDFIETITERPREQLVKYLRRAEIFVATPIQEGLGISILEAMSCELPVVITSCGGPEDIIRKSNGGIVTTHNEKDFSKAVINLLKNESLRENMGKNGRSFIQKNLSFLMQKKRLKIELGKLNAGQQ